MSGSLDRLLRIRELLEELRLTEFAAQAARLRKLEECAERLAIAARSSREEWFRGMCEKEGRSVFEERLSREADRQREQIGELRGPLQREVEQARRRFMAERTGRLQIQSLRDAGDIVELSDAGRREQRRLDEWFLFRHEK